MIVCPSSIHAPFSTHVFLLARIFAHEARYIFFHAVSSSKPQQESYDDSLYVWPHPHFIQPYSQPQCVFIPVGSLDYAIAFLKRIAVPFCLPQRLECATGCIDRGRQLVRSARGRNWLRERVGGGRDQKLSGKETKRNLPENLQISIYVSVAHQAVRYHTLLPSSIWRHL